MFSNWVSTFLSPRSSWVLQERRQFCTSSQSQNLRSTHVIEVRISKRFVKSRVSRSMKQLGTVTLHPISLMKESWRGSSNCEENLKQRWKSDYLWIWPQSGDPIAVVHTFLILQWWRVLSWHFIRGWSPDHGDGLGIQFGNRHLDFLHNNFYWREESMYGHYFLSLSWFSRSRKQTSEMSLFTIFSVLYFKSWSPVHPQCDSLCQSL